MTLVCNLNAIEVAERQRYKDLVQRLHEAMRDNGGKELADGYAYRLDSKGITLPEVAEWMAMERSCCPFLTLELSAPAGCDDWFLKLTGPTGVKPILQAAFPMR